MTQTYLTAVLGAVPCAGPGQAALAALRRLAAEDSGQDMIEYALVASFMGLTSVVGINGLASKIANDLNLVLSGFNAALAGHI